MDESKFKLYSLGIVAEDKPTGTYTISVMPIEQLSDSNNDINQTTEYNTDTVDHKNRSIKSHSEASTVLEAIWIPLGHSNRMSAPDVIKGETVHIYTYADTNEYYWTTVFNEPSIRRNEKVLYGYSNMSSGARDEAFDRESSYWVEIDTLNKYMKIHTSDNNGELTTYDITIDTRNGFIEIVDGMNNTLIHNSKENSLYAKYNESITLEAPLVNIKATDTVIETSNYMLSSNETTMSTSGTTHISSNNNVLSSSDLTISSNDFSVGSGSITMSGSIAVEGNVRSQGTVYAKDFVET